MTFKHVKFEDSVTMRSLERLAKEKGLVQSDTIQKTAAASQPDYSTSSNLMENILKLCAGLRELGDAKYANELEEKFLSYKQATSLYEAFDETGDDVIDFAHPKGSHKIEGVEGDAIVETILDQHLKMVEISNKKPSGKLGSQKDILNAVKIVLSQKAGTADLLKNINDSLASINDIYNSISFFGKPLYTTVLGDLAKRVSVLKSDLSENNIRTLLVALRKAEENLSPGLLGGLSKDDWNDLNPFFVRISQNANALLKELKNPGQADVKPAVNVDPSVSLFSSEIKNILSTLNIWATKIQTDPENSPQDVKEGMSWINGKITRINDLKKMFDGLDVDAKLQAVSLLSNNLNAVKKDFEEFRKTWIG